MTRPARQLLASLGFLDFPPCFAAVTEAALAAAQRRGMERAARVLEEMVEIEDTSARREFLQFAALQIRARKGGEE